MIKTENLSYKYPSEKEAIQFPDINLKDEENLLILGKSGIGKTTLLHLLAGLLTPYSGKININNTDLNELSAAKKDHFVGQNIGIVFQKNHAIRSLNLTENLKARLYFSKKTINEDLILNLLQELELEDLKGKATNQISVGQMQRLNIALAVVHKPNVILADEPTSSLDDKNCEAVMNLLLNQAKQKQANLVVITHDYRVKAMFKNVLSL